MQGFIDKQVFYFVQAVHFGGIRAAADALNIAPSAVSRQIASLEKTLDITLFERHTKGMITTEAGNCVLAYYKNAIANENNLKVQIANLKGGHSGNIVISAGAGYIRILSKFMAQFSARYPNVKIRLEINSSNEIIRRITENEAHVGVIYNPINHPNIRSHISFSHQLCAFISTAHPFAKRHIIDMTDLVNERLALPDITHGIRQIITQSEQQEGVILSPNLLCNDMNLLKEYAREGGVTLLPEFMLYPEDRDVIIRPLKQAIFRNARTQIISRRGRQFSPATQTLITELIALLKTV